MEHGHKKIVDLHIKHGDFTVCYVKLSKGRCTSIFQLQIVWSDTSWRGMPYDPMMVYWKNRTSSPKQKDYGIAFLGWTCHRLSQLESGFPSPQAAITSSFSGLVVFQPAETIPTWTPGRSEFLRSRTGVPLLKTWRGQNPCWSCKPNDQNISKPLMFDE